MPVVLVRHADAENDSPVGDNGRALTPLGRAQAKDTAAWLKRFLPQLPPLVFASPYMRTVQTAEILVSTWGEGTVSSAKALLPGQTLAAAAQIAVRASGVALVGHQPMMGELAAELLGRAVPMPFERAAAMVFEPGPEGGFVFRAYREPFGEPLLTL